MLKFFLVNMIKNKLFPNFGNGILQQFIDPQGENNCKHNLNFLLI